MSMRVSRFAIQIVITVLMCAVFRLPCLAQSQSAEKAGGSVSGVVLRAVDGQPVRHAHVEFVAPSTGWAASTLTDNGGKFAFAGLSPASYQVIVTAPACERLEATVKVDGSVGPVLLRLHEVEQAPTPRNDAVVSVRELGMGDKAESAFAKGTRLLQKGDAQESLIYFQRALAKDPGYYRAYHNMGLAHYQLGDRAQAEQDFQESINLTNGGYTPSQFALGMILCEKQEFREAERLIQNGLAMEPGSAVGKYFLGLVQFAMNRPAEAERSARDALWRNADQAEAHILLAKIHERAHKPYAVTRDVAAYLELDPHGPLESEATGLLQRAQQRISLSAGANQ
jgi:tetratricopeptide (TPR) repeat protein